MTRPDARRRRATLAAAIALNAAALLALAWSLGVVNLNPLAWFRPAEPVASESASSGSTSNSMSMNLFDIFPDEESKWRASLAQTAEDAERGEDRAEESGEGDAEETVEPVATSSVPASSAAVADDPYQWPFWRGPHYNGISTATGLVDTFDPSARSGGNVLWKRTDLGTRSTPIVMGGKLYVLARAAAGTKEEGERVVCVDAMTGETVWETRFNVWLSDVPAERVAWSSVVGDPATGRVYALGVCGYFVCLDGQTGQTIWSVPMHEYFGMVTTYGGRTNFPVICEDLVIVGGLVTGWGDMARPAHRLVGFDKRTGEVVWMNGTSIGPHDTNYSAPSVTNVAGVKMLIFGSGDGRVWSFQPRTGLPIWNYEISRRGLNIAPLVVGDTVYMGHSEENEVGTAMGTVLAIDATGRGDLTQTCEKWRAWEVMMGKSSPVLVDGRLYCAEDGAKLSVFDAATGQAVADRLSLGTAMRSSLLLADGKLYVASATGRWFILRPDAEQGVEMVSQGRFPRGEECDASPIAALGNVYFTTSGAIYCLRDPDKQPSTLPLPAEPPEQTVERDRTPAHVQIVPAELLLLPGQQQQFVVRLFNASGQWLEDVSAEMSVDGPGTITAEGLYTADAGAAHQAAIVSARVGDLQGRARVRIVPPLPWEFTFDDLTEPPITWVGARFRHVVRSVDGSPALVKVTTIPKGTRSRCWFGPTDLSNYTVEAEVRGAMVNDKMPDIGIIAQGYCLDLQGAKQQLQIRSWDPQLRMAQTVEFAWKPDTWYVLKLQASIEGGQAVLRGKAWPRGTPEPDAWTVEASDSVPVLSGSPGLFGNATDAELTLDNLRVYPNPQ
jgi:outer membrane protein assembly factor BamB